MLAHPTHERLIALGLPDMAKAFEEQRRSPDIAAFSFEERLTLMVDREAAERDMRRLAARLKFGSLWIDRAEDLLITGPTGIGNSWLACALCHSACRDGRSVLYQRTPRLFEALALARRDGRCARPLKSLTHVQLLILDDWGLSVLTQAEQRDLLELFEDRHQRASTIVTSQIPVDQWRDVIGNATLADAILDRLVHNAHRLTMTRESPPARVRLTASLSP
jgi:DNA replication protein DnaC